MNKKSNKIRYIIVCTILFAMLVYFIVWLKEFFDATSKLKQKDLNRIYTVYSVEEDTGVISYFINDNDKGIIYKIGEDEYNTIENIINNSEDYTSYTNFRDNHYSFK